MGVAYVAVVVVVPADHSGCSGHRLAEGGVGCLCCSRLIFVLTALDGAGCESLQVSAVLCWLAGWSCCCWSFVLCPGHAELLVREEWKRTKDKKSTRVRWATIMNDVRKVAIFGQHRTSIIALRCAT